MTIQARLYQHPDYKGRDAVARLYLETPVQAYGRYEKSWFKSVKLHDAVSSVKTYASPNEEGGWLYLFQHHDYRGRFEAFYCAPGEEHGEPSFKTLKFDNKATSALLMRDFKKQLPISLGDYGDPSLRERIAERIDAEPDLKLRGEPIVTWDMWPGDLSNRKYVYLRIPAKADVPNWWDYDVEIRYWLYFYLDANGRVRGFVDWYGCWVEGGPWHGRVMDRIMGRLPATLPRIERDLQDSLSSLERMRFERVLLRPGRAFSRGGHTNDDVSLVLVKEE